MAAEVLHCPPQDVHVISGDTIMHCLIKAHMPRPVLASRVTCAFGSGKSAGENPVPRRANMGEPVADVQLATPGVVRGKKAKLVSER